MGDVGPGRWSQEGGSMEGEQVALGSGAPAGVGRGGAPSAQQSQPSPSTCASRPCWLEGESLGSFQASEPGHGTPGKTTVEADPVDGTVPAVTGRAFPGPLGRALSFSFLNISRVKGGFFSVAAGD